MGFRAEPILAEIRKGEASAVAWRLRRSLPRQYP
jgi:hypothetical protein